jgi:hypothetical protein
MGAAIFKGQESRSTHRDSWPFLSPNQKRMQLTADNKLKKLIIVGDRVLIRLKKPHEKTGSGLYLPPGVQEKEKVQQGYIIKAEGGKLGVTAAFIGKSYAAAPVATQPRQKAQKGRKPNG